MLMIRLSRMGARKQPHYRIVVIEKARARNGRPVEVVGSERVGKLYSKPAAAPAASVA